MTPKNTLIQKLTIPKNNPKICILDICLQLFGFKQNLELDSNYIFCMISIWRFVSAQNRAKSSGQKKWVDKNETLTQLPRLTKDRIFIILNKLLITSFLPLFRIKISHIIFTTESRINLTCVLSISQRPCRALYSDKYYSALNTFVYTILCDI